MKNIKSYLVLCVGLLFVSNCFAQQSKLEWIKKDTKMTYDVKTKNSSYQFVAEITNLKPDIAFNFAMTDSKNTKGNVKISAEAFQTAVKFNNYFSSGELILTDMTSVWVSKTVYSSLKKAQDIMVDFGDGLVNLKYIKKDRMTFLINGTNSLYSVIYAETESGQKMWILDDGENPIILKMDLGWTIEIKSVESK